MVVLGKYGNFALDGKNTMQLIVLKGSSSLDRFCVA